MTEAVSGLVSVVIPAFNRAGMLREAVESVFAQTWGQYEILICDDGSTDDTVALGKSLQAEHPGVVRYLWAPNGGAGIARERGRLQARGEFLQYLDSDDTLWPRKFEMQVAALRAHPECGAAYGWIRLCPEDGAPADRPHKWSGREIRQLFPALLVDRWWNTNAPLWRRSVCDAIGPWSDLRYSQDWDYDARAGALGIQLAYCPEFVTDQRHHGAARQTGSGRWLVPADRVRFFTSLFDSAQRAEVAKDTPEMRHFARWVFSHARQCAALGDKAAADALLRLAIQAQGKMTMELSVFRGLVGLVGWHRATRWIESVQRLRGRKSGPSTRKQSWMA